MGFELRKHLPSVDDLNRWAQGVKSAAVTLLAVGTATVTGVGTFNAVTSDAVSVEPLKVPAPFEEQGFTSEVATARLLDEIATYERQQSSAKEKVSIMSKSQHDELQRLQVASVGGLDVQRVEGLIQDALGIQRQSITGEITFRKEGEVVNYHVRLRRLPGNQVLLDLKTQGEPQAVLKKTALAMIEVFDPHIAGAIYWRNKDEDNALRMIDVVLNNDRPEDDKYSLNLRSQMNVVKKRYDPAWADFERIMKIDPNFAPAHGTASWIHLEKKDYDAALAEAEQTIALAPKKWWGYNAKARALRDMKRLDEAASLFRQAIAIKPDAPGPYMQAGLFFASQKQAEEALGIFRKGLLLFPEHAGLNVAAGDMLRQLDEPERADRAYQLALTSEPGNLAALLGRYEIAQQQGRTAELAELRKPLAAAGQNPAALDKALRERLQAVLEKG